MNTIVSEGTMRPEDLIPKFLDELKERDANLHKLTVEDPDFARVLEDKDWDGEMACYLLDALFDRLNVTAPDGYHFGLSYLYKLPRYGFWELGELAMDAWSWKDNKGCIHTGE